MLGIGGAFGSDWIGFGGMGSAGTGRIGGNGGASGVPIDGTGGALGSGGIGIGGSGGAGAGTMGGKLHMACHGVSATLTTVETTLAGPGPVAACAVTAPAPSFTNPPLT